MNPGSPVGPDEDVGDEGGMPPSPEVADENEDEVGEEERMEAVAKEPELDRASLMPEPVPPCEEGSDMLPLADKEEEEEDWIPLPIPPPPIPPRELPPLPSEGMEPVEVVPLA